MSALTPKWIWPVVVNNALYVRAYNGQNFRPQYSGFNRSRRSGSIVVRRYYDLFTSSPLEYCSWKAGKKVAIVGLGDLGHLAVQFATKMGTDVTVVTTPDKEKDARRFGAKDVLINKDGADFSKNKKAFNFILDTFLPT